MSCRPHMNACWVRTRCDSLRCHAFVSGPLGTNGYCSGQCCEGVCGGVNATSGDAMCCECRFCPVHVTLANSRVRPRVMAQALPCVALLHLPAVLTCRVTIDSAANRPGVSNPRQCQPLTSVSRHRCSRAAGARPQALWAPRASVAASAATVSAPPIASAFHQPP